MKHVTGTISIIILVFFAGQLRAFNDVASYEKKISDSYIAGDYDALYNNLTEMLLSRPDHPASIIHLPDLAYGAWIYGPESVLAVLDGMEKKNRRHGRHCRC